MTCVLLDQCWRYVWPALRCWSCWSCKTKQLTFIVCHIVCCCCSAIGDLYNFHLDPSLTLGCGSWGSTSVSANVGPQHLINIKTGVLQFEPLLC